MTKSALRKKDGRLIDYLIIAVIGLVLLYPIIWMIFSTFKSNEEIFGSTALLPSVWHWENYTQGWMGSSRITYTTFFYNTFKLVVPTTLLTVLSACLTAYAFARFNFPCKGPLFALMVGLMMLPNSVVIIPRYMLYNQFKWVDTYMPFYIPALLCCNSFFLICSFSSCAVFRVNWTNLPTWMAAPPCVPFGAFCFR